MAEPLLRLEGIHKAFGPVRALQGVDLAVYPGEVHGLIGENGAGKSTLMKVLSGLYAADAGQMWFGSRPYTPQSPLEGRDAGISMIYQELNLAPHLTVEENITLGIEETRLGWLRSRTAVVREALAALGQADLAPNTVVKALSIGKQQLVEIARALVADAKVVVMDEPTSSLSADDVEALFRVIRRLRDKGVAVIYISHFLEEVQEVCDRYTVLRDGETVATGPVAEVSIGALVNHMVGRSVDELYPKSDHTIGEEVLRVEGLEGRRSVPKGVSVSLRRGEILGIFGLVGAGRSEALRALFGLEQAAAGTLTIPGHPTLQVATLTPGRALDEGLDLLSEDRKAEGLAQSLSILTNLTLSAVRRYSRGGFISRKAEKAGGERWFKALNIRYRDASQPAETLSGGNQQKICLARLLHHDSDILFLDEPTRGIDIGSKAEIYRLIHELAAAGKAIILVGSYLPELLGLCDTLAVMHKGQLSEVRPVASWTEQTMMHYATSGNV